MNALRQYAAARRNLFVVVAAIGVLTALIGRPAPQPGQPLDVQLSAITGLRVETGSIVWLDGRAASNLRTATNGGDIVFLASLRPGTPRDLYIAEARLAPGPTLLDVSSLVNLTRTDAGDEFLFKVHGSLIATATRALQEVRSITLFDLRGQPLPEDGSWTSSQRVLARISDLQRTGRPAGIDRRSIHFSEPATRVDFSILDKEDGQSFILEWTNRTGGRHLQNIDLRSDNGEAAGIHVQKEVRLPKRPVLWMVDSVRAVPWIGPGPIEWLEGRVFAARDRLNRWTWSLRSTDADESDAVPGRRSRPARTIVKLSPDREVGDPSPVVWPPDNLEPPVFSSAKQGEGEWVPAEQDFMQHLPDAPPSVYRTWVRCDETRPYVRVQLYAIDTRQLNLHMVGGHEDPISTTGEVGTGRIPRDPDLTGRVALAFNGAFKTMHGEYGMMADRTVLLPPKDDAATIAVDDDGRIGMGSWPKGQPIPADMVSYRQNMDPLVEKGVVNPRRRYLWGFTLDEDISMMNTIRSGICMTDDGTLIYAWGEDLTARTLGVTMNAARCTYGIHLDMNPFHTVLVAFRFAPYAEGTKPEFKYRHLIKETMYSPPRLVNGAPKDFFFMTLRDNSPPGDGWSAAGLTQPAPAFLPAVHRKVDNGVRFIAVDLHATAASLFHGAVPDALADIAAPSAPFNDSRLVAELVLGTWSSGQGQLMDGQEVASLVPDGATLAISDGGGIRLLPFTREGLSEQQALQGAWLLRDGDEKPGRGPVIGIAIRDDRWFIAAHGDWNDVRDAFQKSGVHNAVAFSEKDVSFDLLVRRGGRLVTVDGTHVAERSGERIAVRFSAAKRTALGTRLDALFR